MGYVLAPHSLLISFFTLLTMFFEVYNIANHHLEAETLATLRKRLQRLKGPALPRVRETFCV